MDDPTKPTTHDLTVPSPAPAASSDAVLQRAYLALAFAGARPLTDQEKQRRDQRRRRVFQSTIARKS